MLDRTDASARRARRCARYDLAPSRPHGDRHAAAGAGGSSTRGLAIVCALPTMPKRGASSERDAPVALVRVAGDERMHGAAKPSAAACRRNVVDDAIGDQDGAADPLGRHIGQRARGARTGRCRRWPSPSPTSTTAHLDVGQAPAARASARAHGVGLGRAVGQRLARRAVDARRRRRPSAARGPRATGRVGQRQDEKQARARRAAPMPRRAARRQNARPTRRRRPAPAATRSRPGQKRREDEAQTAHWPSLSSRAGTCTWSAL